MKTKPITNQVVSSSYVIDFLINECGDLRENRPKIKEVSEILKEIADETNDRTKIYINILDARLQIYSKKMDLPYKGDSFRISMQGICYVIQPM